MCGAQGSTAGAKRLRGGLSASLVGLCAVYLLQGPTLEAAEDAAAGDGSQPFLPVPPDRYSPQVFKVGCQDHWGSHQRSVSCLIAQCVFCQLQASCGRCVGAGGHGADAPGCCTPAESPCARMYVCMWQRHPCCWGAGGRDSTDMRGQCRCDWANTRPAPCWLVCRLHSSSDVPKRLVPAGGRAAPTWWGRVHSAWQTTGPCSWTGGASCASPSPCCSATCARLPAMLQVS